MRTIGSQLTVQTLNFYYVHFAVSPRTYSRVITDEMSDFRCPSFLPLAHARSSRPSTSDSIGASCTYQTMSSLACPMHEHHPVFASHPLWPKKRNKHAYRLGRFFSDLIQSTTDSAHKSTSHAMYQGKRGTSSIGGHCPRLNVRPSSAIATTNLIR